MNRSTATKKPNHLGDLHADHVRQSGFPGRVRSGSATFCPCLAAGLAFCCDAIILYNICCFNAHSIPHREARAFPAVEPRVSSGADVSSGLTPSPDFSGFPTNTMTNIPVKPLPTPARPLPRPKIPAGPLARPRGGTAFDAEAPERRDRRRPQTAC